MRREERKNELSQEGLEMFMVHVAVVSIRISLHSEAHFVFAQISTKNAFHTHVYVHCTLLRNGKNVKEKHLVVSGC